MRVYLNLTGGIEALKEDFCLKIPKGVCLENVRFVRIPSTYCEQHLWGRILDGLSDDLILFTALGEEIIIIDFSRHKQSKAIRLGIPWIKLALGRAWIGKDYVPLELKKNKVLYQYFLREYAKLPKTTLSRLKFYRKFFEPSGLTNIYITGQSYQTSKDGDYDYFVRLLYEAYGKSQPKMVSLY